MNFKSKWKATTKHLPLHNIFNAISFLTMTAMLYFGFEKFAAFIGLVGATQALSSLYAFIRNGFKEPTPEKAKEAEYCGSVELGACEW